MNDLYDTGFINRHNFKAICQQLALQFCDCLKQGHKIELFVEDRVRKPKIVVKLDQILRVQVAARCLSSRRRASLVQKHLQYEAI